MIQEPRVKTRPANQNVQRMNLKQKIASKILLAGSTIVIYSCNVSSENNKVENETVSKDAIYYFDLGNKYCNEDKNHEAIECFDKAVELSPHIAEIYVRRGMAKSELQQIDDAIKDLEIAIRLSPDNLSIIEEKGIIEYKAGLYEEALKDLDLVIRKNSTFGHSYFIRGLIKIEMGLQDEACEDFYKAKYYGEDEADARIEENCQRS